MLLSKTSGGPPGNKVGQDPFEVLTHPEDLHHHDRATTNNTNSSIIPDDDPFDPESHRMEPLADVEVEHILTTVPVRRPKGSREFVRVHPEFVVDRFLLERDTGMEKECYLVLPEVQYLVLPELRRTRLHVAVNKQGTVFIWPIKLPLEGTDNGGRLRFNSASRIAEQAKTKWVKSVWNRGQWVHTTCL